MYYIVGTSISLHKNKPNIRVNVSVKETKLVDVGTYIDLRKVKDAVTAATARVIKINVIEVA